MGVLLRVEKTASMQISRCWSQNQDLRAMQISQRRSARGGDRSEASDASNELSAKRAQPFAHSGSMTGKHRFEIKKLPTSQTATLRPQRGFVFLSRHSRGHSERPITRSSHQTRCSPWIEHTP